MQRILTIIGACPQIQRGQHCSPCVSANRLQWHRGEEVPRMIVDELAKGAKE